MWALLPLLNDPFADATPACELAATRADHCIFYFTVANKAFKKFVKVLICTLMVA